jgi:hypothetical protein
MSWGSMNRGLYSPTYICLESTGIHDPNPLESHGIPGFQDSKGPMDYGQCTKKGREEEVYG